MSYVFIQSEEHLWTVGFYSPDGKWHSESDHDDQDEAATRVHFLNGGKDQANASTEDMNVEVLSDLESALFLLPDNMNHFRSGNLDPTGTWDEGEAEANELLRLIRKNLIRYRFAQAKRKKS
jgi:hypothetical protein